MACGARAKMDCGRWHGGLPRTAGRQAGWALAWQPGPAEEAARRDAWKRGARHARSRCDHRAQLARARQRGDALNDGVVGTGR
jgi:hypothetical protein